MDAKIFELVNESKTTLKRHFGGVDDVFELYMQRCKKWKDDEKVLFGGVDDVFEL
jgi:hypothetical protein